MSMMFSAVHAVCPTPCTGADPKDCLRSDGHLEIINVYRYRVGANVFSGCTSLKTVSMPEVREIGANAFQDTGLTWVHMPKVQRIDMFAFDGTPYSKNPWQNKTALKVQYSSLGC